jgi:acetyl-CoA carboxylase/biotin carboxylase 1
VLGDKIAAGILAQTAGVPSIPWSGDGLKAELTKDGTIPDETFKRPGCRPGCRVCCWVRLPMEKSL